MRHRKVGKPRRLPTNSYASSQRCKNVPCHARSGGDRRCHDPSRLTNQVTSTHSGSAALALLKSFDDFLRSFFLGGYQPILPVLIYGRLLSGFRPRSTRLPRSAGDDHLARPGGRAMVAAAAVQPSEAPRRIKCQLIPAICRDRSALPQTGDQKNATCLQRAVVPAGRRIRVRDRRIPLVLAHLCRGRGSRIPRGRCPRFHRSAIPPRWCTRRRMLPC
jgi:hypothetical protein